MICREGIIAPAARDFRENSAVFGRFAPIYARSASKNRFCSVNLPAQGRLPLKKIPFTFF